MKTALFLSFLTITMGILNAQVVNIPDTNFKNKLLQANSSNTIAQNLSGSYFKIDSNNDGQIQSSEAQQVSYLDVKNSNISSLTGINNFTSLVTLNCKLNRLTSLDVRGISNLGVLYCDNNTLSSLLVSGLSNLVYLYCQNNLNLTTINLTGLNKLILLECFVNKITTLDFSETPKLQTLSCNNNSLSSLNISGLQYLSTLNCSNNQLTSFNLKNGNNAAITMMTAQNNPNLTCIQVDNVTNANSYSGWTKDTTASYSTDCSATMSTVDISKNQVLLFPNPTKDILYLSEPLTDIQILEMSGKAVSSAKEKSSTINTEKLIKGNYLITGKDQNGNTMTQKFIKE